MSGEIITLTRHIIDEQHRFPQATGQFTNLMNDICFAAKRISYYTNKAGLLDILGETDKVNVQGEKVKKLDVFANETLIRALDHGGNLCCMASEEEADIIPIPKQYRIGKYVCLFDPLDGSANIDANVSVGTIFSIYRRVTPDGRPGMVEDCLQPGYKQLCAGYVVYGSSTMLVYTTGNGVHGFTLDPSYGEFVLSHPDIKTPEKGSIYSINESNFDYWDQSVRNYIRYVKDTDQKTGRPLNSRYIGSMVSDIHRNLLYGGIYLYPASSRTPQGKLRLMYEANPMAYVVEQAGGRATNGLKDILQIQPKNIHERVPLFIGSVQDVTMVESFIRADPIHQ
jgi:fructose-1,6-bisphosphatase I